MTDGGRPQDQERTHRRRGRPSAATVSLLARYQASMRAALGATLDELDGKPTGQLGLDGQALADRPGPARQRELWDLAIKLARELGTEVDDVPAPAQTPPSQRARRSRKVDFGGS